MVHAYVIQIANRCQGRRNVAEKPVNRGDASIGFAEWRG